jgi:DNA-binding protein H-NS
MGAFVDGWQRINGCVCEKHLAQACVALYHGCLTMKGYLMSTTAPAQSVAELRKQAKQLEEQAAAMEQAEKQKAIDEVRALCAANRLTAEDIFPAKRTRGSGAAAQKPKGPPYYIDPKTGITGQKLGKPSQWVLDLRAANTPESQYVIHLMSPEALAAARAKSAAFTAPAESAAPAAKAPAKAAAKKAPVKAAAKPAVKAPAKAAAKKAK